MRHPGSFTYRMHTLPAVPRVLDFIVEQAGLGPEDAYGTLNMGAGFALFVADSQVPSLLEVCRRTGTPAVLAGRVEDGPKQVLIEPLDVVFGAESLQLR
jgi:phosphoribosylformylglycinamidine cyclo-ligase